MGLEKKSMKMMYSFFYTVEKKVYQELPDQTDCQRVLDILELYSCREKEKFSG